MTSERAINGTTNRRNLIFSRLSELEYFFLDSSFECSEFSIIFILVSEVEEEEPRLFFFTSISIISSLSSLSLSFLVSLLSNSSFRSCIELLPSPSMNGSLLELGGGGGEDDRLVKNEGR